MNRFASVGFFLVGLLGLASCRGVALEQRLSDLPSGKVAETGAFTKDFIIPIDALRRGNALYVQEGRVLTRMERVQPTQPFCRLSSIRYAFENPDLANRLGITQVRMSRYEGALSPWVDDVYLIRSGHAFRAGARTEIPLRQYQETLYRARMGFSFEGDLECFWAVDRASSTDTMTLATFFRILGFEWVWKPEFH